MAQGTTQHRHHVCVHVCQPDSSRHSIRQNAQARCVLDAAHIDTAPAHAEIEATLQPQPKTAQFKSTNKHTSCMSSTVTFTVQATSWRCSRV